MSTASGKSPPPRKPAPDADDDTYAVNEPDQPVASSPLAEERLRLIEKHRASIPPQRPPAPRLPMLNGIFGFPFRINTFGPWLTISAGLMVTAWLFMFWIQYGAVLGMTSARLIGLPVCLFATMTLGYAASCALTIIEATSYGRDDFEIVAGLDWKEWAWKLGHIVAIGLQAAMVGLAVQTLGLSESHMPMMATMFFAFPFFLLGALAASGAWVPLEILSVVRSLPRLWHVWILFFVETGLMFFGWFYVTRDGLTSESPWLTPLYAAPLLATIILIYARLIGRIAACISVATQQHSSEGNELE